MRYLVSSILFFNLLFAHPHTFIDLFPSINSKNNKINSLHFKWRFDEMTSGVLLMEFDQNMDGVLDKNEILYARDNFFYPLKEFGYYTDLKIANKKIPINPKNFIVKIEDKINISFEFEIDINANKNDLQIDFYDQDMFTAFMLKKDFVKSDLGFKIVDVDNDFYFAYRLQFN